MNLKIKVKSEDIKWFFVSILKTLSFMWIAVTGMVCIVYYRFLPTEQQTELLPVAILCVGILFVFLTIIPQSPVSHHRLVCEQNKEPKIEAG